MDEGCAKGCAGIVVGIIVISLLFSGMAYAGMAVIIGIEYLALSFTWIGAGSPILGWGLLGVIAGGVAGLLIGLNRAGRKIRPVEMAGAGLALGVLFLFLGTRAAASGDFDPPAVVERPAVVEEEERAAFTVAITAERLNVREGPSTGRAVVATVAEGDELGVLSSRGSWYQVLVESEGKTQRGWISRAYAQRVQGTGRGRIAEAEPPEERAGPSAPPFPGRPSPADEPEERASPVAPVLPPEEKEPEVFMIVEEDPELIGGLGGLQEEVEYPERARRAGIEGRVFIQFIVDENGNVTQPTVLRSPHELLSEEALRVIREAKFRPGKQRGRAVKVKTSLPVSFALRESEQRQRPSTDASSEREEKRASSASVSFRPNASATAEIDGNRFKVTVLSGVASRMPGGDTKLELEVQQQSVNFDGEWVRWSPILKESYLVDDQGRRHAVQRSASDNLRGGRVQPGTARTGTVVFHMDRPPAELGRMTLHFAYFPYQGTKIVQVPFSVQ